MRIVSWYIVVFFFFKQKTAYELRISDWSSDVCSSDLGENRIEVSGARGHAPSDQYKVSATYQDGFRSSATMMIGGVDAVRKAEAVGAAILKRTRTLFAARGLADYTRTDVAVLGRDADGGANARRSEERRVGKGGVRA